MTGADAVVRCDVASEESVAAAFDAVHGEFGAPLVVVDNAGFTRDQPLDRMPLSDWDAVAAAETSPVGRIGHPEDIAHAVSFFTGEGARYVTGQVLYVAGAPVG